MEIHTWYQWLLVQGYEIGQLLFLAALVILSLRTRGPAVILATLGFLAFVLGNIQMLWADVDHFQAIQTGQAQGPLSETAAWLRGRIASSGGFALSGAALLWYGVRGDGPSGGRKSKMPAVPGVEQGVEK